MNKQLGVLALGTLLALTGCANGDMYSGDVYSAQQAKTVQTVSYGTLTSVRPVKIQEQDNGTMGTLAGGVLGGVLAHGLGGGSGKQMATVAGALGGAVAGKAIGDKMGQVDGAELEIRKENGDTIVVVQKASPTYVPGSRVRIVQSGSKTTVSVTN